MIEEKTKFRNGMERKFYMDDVLHEFLDCYQNKNFEYTNRKGMEIIGMINDYNDKYFYFVKLTNIIAIFLKELYGIGNEFSKFLNIKSSCKKQFNLLYTTKTILKKVPVENKYYVALKYNVEKISERLDYLTKYVVFSYLEMTPILNYIKILEDEGKSLEKEIMEKFPDMVNDSEDFELRKYMEEIFSKVSDNQDWKKGRDIYLNFLNEKRKSMEENKMEEKLNKKKLLAKDAEQKLIITGNNIEKIIMRGDNAKLSVRMIGNKIFELKQAGEKNAKLIMLAKTSRGINAKAYYYSQDSSNFLTNSLCKATVLKENVELPNEILDKIKSFDMVFKEILLPA